MAWVIGIDEAGYGPNLGPFVMTAVAAPLPETHDGANLWDVFRAAVRRDGQSRIAGIPRFLAEGRQGRGTIVRQQTTQVKCVGDGEGTEQ